jgi:ribosomal protein S18 acetylase RimI-like enzyme
MSLGLRLPAGVTTRPASMDDIDAVTRLIEACEVAEDGEVEIDRSDVVSSWSRPSFRPERDARIVAEGDRLLAWAEVFQGRRAEADVHPAHRGRGIGSALLGWTEAAARDAGGSLVGQSVTDANTGAMELFRANGYEPLWTSWILQIPLTVAPEPAVLPEGVELRPFHPERDGPAAFRVIDGAFSEVPDPEPTRFEDWAAKLTGHAAFSPPLSRLAWQDGRIVGAGMVLDYGPENEGWVQQLAVDARHRNRGIARALLTDVFRAFHERGASACGLSTDSRTGALGLYEKVGMRVRRSYTHWAKELT